MDTTPEGSYNVQHGLTIGFCDPSGVSDVGRVTNGLQLGMASALHQHVIERRRRPIVVPLLLKTREQCIH